MPTRLLRTTLLAACLTAPLPAQAVRGRVLLPDSTTPVAGAAVTILDDQGRAAARTISGRDGAYSVRLPHPGRYELQVLRIGYRPTRRPLADIGAGDIHSADIILAADAIELQAVNITDHDNCGLRGPDAEVFLRVWEQARAALSATHLSDRSGDGSLDVHVLELDGLQDRPDGREPGPSNRRVEADSALARETYSARLFATTPTETLDVSGYVRRRADGSVHFDAPSADALLSDLFLARHCFGVARAPDDHRDWIGITFKPIADRDTLADVVGTLWLSERTSQLRRLDFSYENLQYLPRVCNATGDFCLNSNNGRGTGGTMTFAYTPAGEWLVSRWTIRTPPELFAVRNTGNKARVDGRRPEACYGGRGCERILVMVPRLSVNTGAIASLAREGAEVFRDDSVVAAVSRIAAKQAGKKQGHISGTITDSTGRPLSRVVISTDDPVRAAITNDSGFFELRSLPASRLNFSVKKPGFASFNFPLPLIADSTRHIQLKLIASPSAKP